LRKVGWVLFVFLLFTPMIAEYFFVSEILPIAQIMYSPWKDAPLSVFLSDIYFIEGAVLIVFGALVGGATIYTAWASTDVRKAQFTEYIWNWKKIKDERNFPTGLTFGLILIFGGIIYIIFAIVVSR
jgi:hypothetical protein